MPKTSIRQQMLARRRLLGAETCLGHSLRIQNELLRMPLFQRAEHVALYSPFLNEVFTEEIFLEARRQGKIVYYPRVCDAELKFVEVEDLGRLYPGAFKILEPDGDAVRPARDMDLMVVPGVAYDLRGFRLGYGQGFYDRALARGGRPGYVIGLCFDFQIVEALPAEDHDIRMDAVLSEDRYVEPA